MRRILPVFVLLLVFLGLLVSCDPPSFEYRGEYESLYTAANHSIIGMETRYDDEIVLLETDSYGRVMYMMRTHSWNVRDKYIAAVLIAQNYNDSTVSYYEFDNVIYCYTDYFKPSAESISSFFSEDQISQMKEKNDWETAVCYDKMTTQSVCTSDHDMDLVSSDQIENIKKELFDGVSFSKIFADQMTEFKDGRIVCLFGRKFYNEESDEEDSFYIVVFSNDNDQTQQYICEEVEDVLNIQEQLNGMLE